VPREFVSSQDLERIAKQFLQQHHPSLELPIPIEEIAEFAVGLNIVPIPGLYRDYKIESWLSCDQKAVFVDLRQCEEMETRYRFSLAHEIGHLLLHADLYREVSLGSFEDWISFHEGLDPATRDSLEWQARSLAGRILVPAEPLVRHAQEQIDAVKLRLPKGVDPEALFGAVAIPLSDIFNVHEEVVRIRLSGDGIGRRLRVK